MKNDYETNFWITEAMIRYGGSFVRDLARLYRQADMLNAKVLRDAFQEYWEDYDKLKDNAKQAAEQEG